MNCFRFSLLLVSFVQFLPNASGQLQFQRNELEFWPSYQESSVMGRFSFANVGDYPVTVTRVETVCNCTVTRMAKKMYEPGEGGEIFATLAFQGRQGTMQRPVFVHTDDRSKKKITLNLKAHIPLLAEVKPLAVFWRRGEQRTPKTMRIKFVTESPTRLIRVDKKSDAVSTKIKEIKKGREYEVVVTPSSTSKKFKSSLTLVTDFPFEERKKVKVYAMVP
ncbi:MAG: DUF1573 domain-containing protein [Planctomycetota bacterium]|jgi:hypothetical protein|nr:DUF1573 domain-containing protein [Planctomycetota bacterium]